jgi:hypothetical protein
MRTLRWTCARTWAATFTAALTVLLAGCGGTAGTGGPRPTGSPVVASGDPDMVMITLGPDGYKASTIEVSKGHQVMFMISNTDTLARKIHSPMPVSAVTVEDPMASYAPPPIAREPSLDATVPPGRETDVIFTPSATGDFAISYDSVPMGTVVVN